MDWKTSEVPYSPMFMKDISVEYVVRSTDFKLRVTRRLLFVIQLYLPFPATAPRSVVQSRNLVVSIGSIAIPKNEFGL